MSGPVQYRAAERQQERARALAAADESPGPAETAARVQRQTADLAEAQLHATLALAAAVGLSAHPDAADAQAWRETAGAVIGAK